MALTNLHTNWDIESYENDRNTFLGLAENTTGNYTHPYYDTSIAIGYGFDLIQHSAAEIRSYLNRVNVTLGLQDAQRATLTQHDIFLLNEARTATLARRQEISQQLNLTFPSQNYAVTLRNIKLTEYETALDTTLGGHFQLADSKERIAIISLLYNITTPNANAIRDTIPSTIAAIKNDNRAEAWYEIRYNSNLNGIHANRRYREANLFGLYDSGTLTPDQQTAQAKEIMRMYTRYEVLGGSQLSTYETQYRPPSGIDGINALNGVGNASNYLVQNYAMGNTIDGWVIIGQGLDSYNYIEKGYWTDNIIGNNQNDLIFGEKANDILNGSAGNDVIYGGEGNDTLIGGAGNDALIGGSGDDTYIFSANEINGAGEFTDTIIDQDKDGTLIFQDENGNEIKRMKLSSFYKTENGTWTKIVNWIEGTINGAITFIYDAAQSLGRIILPNNAGAIELQNFQSGNFGINLIDMPSDPNPTLTIAGDLTPTSDPPQYDSLGNVIVDPNTPSPDRNDTLFGSTANDRIEGKGGSDTIYSGLGDDWILGGDGRDGLSSGDGSDIIEGGSGGDLILGGAGDDQLFGEINADMDDIIAAGEVAQSINEQGDLISGETGNDFVYGSDRNDALFGGAGLDILVGGPGDDVIYGDSDFTTAMLNWSYTTGSGLVNFTNVAFAPGTSQGNYEIYAESGNDIVFGDGGGYEIYTNKERKAA